VVLFRSVFLFNAMVALLGWMNAVAASIPHATNSQLSFIL
jgi:hypothetical protein